MEYDKDIVEQGNEKERKKLWNPRGFLVLGPIFSFLPVAILYSLNCGKLGYRKKKRNSLAITFISVFIIIALEYLIDGGIDRIIFTALNIGVAIYAYHDQSNLFKEHIDNGGRKASYLIPVIISLIVSAILIFLLITTIHIPDNKITYNESELYYTERVTEEQAEELGNYLSQQGLFDGGSPVFLKIDKSEDIYKLSFVVDEDYLDDTELQESAKYLSNEISVNVFDNNKVNFILSDEKFKPLKTIE
ncbi:hypothetical protein [Senegalia massiliensis]|uniref:hypothetical protein n=1 Tax=Senegalia massiliensis TaxID=1720316 RepID=UPI001030DC02|nr:hypothetical protein [Senegalia massiliensis]